MERMLSPKEIVERVPVWEAVADLWLDTAIDDRHRDAIADELAEQDWQAVLRLVAEMRAAR